MFLLLIFVCFKNAGLLGEWRETRRAVYTNLCYSLNATMTAHHVQM